MRAARAPVTSGARRGYSSSVSILALGRAIGLRGAFQDFGAFDDDRLHGHVAMRRRTGPGGDFDDTVYHVHALYDLAEHGVAVTRLGWETEIEIAVVRYV